jgi:hypothetical protein
LYDFVHFDNVGADAQDYFLSFMHHKVIIKHHKAKGQGRWTPEELTLT